MGKKSKKFRKPVNPSSVTSAQSSSPEDRSPDIFTIGTDKWRWIVIAVLFVVGLMVYATSFGNEFIWDDAMLIVPNEYIRSWSYIPQIFSTDIHHFGLDNSNFYRPLQAISYMIDHTFWELNPMGYHISSVLIHIANASLVYMNLFIILGHLDPRRRKYIREISLATALIWLVHPIHTQVVTYAAGRADELVVFFMLASIFTFMTCRNAWIAPVFFVGALLSKEYGVILPVFILLLNSFGLTVKRQSRWTNLIPFGIILAVYILLRVTVLNFPTDFSADLIPGFFSRMMTSARAIVILLSLLIAPFDLSMDRNIEWSRSIFDIKVILSILFVIGMAIGGFLARRKLKVVSLGIGWFFVGYLLVLNIVPMNANVSEHWMYMPSIGVLMALIWGGVRLIPEIDRRIFYTVLGCIIVYFSVFLIQRNADFKNEITFYNQILERKYANPRVHYNLGCAYFYEAQNLEGEAYKALEEKSYKHLSEAIRLKPDYAAAYGNLGQLEYRRGNIDRAIQLYQKANSIKDNLIENRANLGIAYVKTKQYNLAVGELSRALELNPNHLGALNNLGIVYGSMGDYKNAERFFRRALSVSPKDPSANKNMQHLYKLMKAKSAQ